MVGESRQGFGVSGSVGCSHNDGTNNPSYTVAPGWTIGAAPYLKARGVGITSFTNQQCTQFTKVLVKLTGQRFFVSQSTTNGPDGTGYSLWSTGLEYRTEIRNGSAVLSKTEQDWSQRAAVVWTGQTAEQIANDNRVNESRNYLDDGSFSKVITTYHQLLGDNNHINNPIQADEYDFDQTLKRRTTTSYLIGGNYTGTGVNTVNILSLPIEQAVFDAADLVNPKSRTNYEYDNYTPDANGNNAVLQTYIDYSSIPGRTQSPEPPFDTTFLTRGNTTKVSRRVSSSTTISSYTRYDVLGNVVSMKDPREFVATIDYLDDFGTGANPGSNTGGHSTYALPTKATSPPPNSGDPVHTAYTQYDFSTGLLTGFKDRNGVITQTFYNDPFNRPTQINAALGTPLQNHTSMYYAPQSNPFGISLTANDVLTDKDQVSLDDGHLRSWTKTDGFGRTIETWTHAPDELYQGSPVSGDIVVKTNYDGLGRVKQTSNPFRPAVLSETAQYTTTGYDLAGRVISVTTLSDNAVVSTAYNGPRVLVTDQAGKQRISKTDGLGRLIEVWEIRSADSVTGTEPVTFPNHSEVQAGYRTKYTYDALDSLSEVKQQIGTSGTTQTRTFLYDGLKRLTRAINPESGTIDYTYDENSNLKTKLDARSITTTYNYDALNRVIGRVYTNDPAGTPAVTYKYDAQTLPSGAPGISIFDRGYSTGRLVSVTYGGTSAGSYTGYDRLGRANVSVQQTDSQNYRFTYGYDLASEMTTEKYPSDKEIRTTYDTAGRISDVKRYINGQFDKTYASQFSYTAHGATNSVTLGNNLIERTDFNNRLQPTFIKLGTTANPTSVLQLGYQYTSACQSGNNGNVMRQTITAPGLSLTQDYCYDSLNRLASASENAGASWAQTYDYDRFGNRAVRVGSYFPTARQTPASNSVSDLSNLFSQSNNRIIAILPGEGATQYGYDPAGAGNLTSMPGKVPGPSDTMTYDAENRQKTYSPGGGAATTYSYDGDGRRVKKFVPGNPSTTTIFVYNVAGQLIAEYTSDPVPPPAGGGGTSYLTSDHLGSTRVETRSDGTVKARYDYLPFGEELPSSVGGRTVGMGYSSADSTKQKFTQKERDNESGLDYFLARYYSSAQGRFTSPDEFTGGPDDLFDFADDASANPTFYADLRNPQSLNKYQYSYNNPLRYVDPDGHDPGEPDPDPDPQQREHGGSRVGPPPPPLTIPADQAEALTRKLVEAEGSFRDWGQGLPIIRDIREWGWVRRVRELIGTEPAPAPVPDTTIPAQQQAQPQPAAPPRTQTQPMPPPPPMAAHPRKKQSTGKAGKGRHQRGEKRDIRSGERADPGRRPPRRPPQGKTPKGGWPPKPKPKPPQEPTK